MNGMTVQILTLECHSAAFPIMTDKIAQLFQIMTKKFAQSFQIMTGKITQLFQIMTEKMTQLFPKITEKITKLFQMMTDKITQLFQIMTDRITQLFQIMTEQIFSNNFRKVTPGHQVLFSYEKEQIGQILMKIFLHCNLIFCCSRLSYFKFGNFGTLNLTECQIVSLRYWEVRFHVKQPNWKKHW